MSTPTPLKNSSAGANAAGATTTMTAVAGGGAASTTTSSARDDGPPPPNAGGGAENRPSIKERPSRKGKDKATAMAAQAQVERLKKENKEIQAAVEAASAEAEERLQLVEKENIDLRFFLFKAKKELEQVAVSAIPKLMEANENLRDGIEEGETKLQRIIESTRRAFPRSPLLAELEEVLAKMKQTRADEEEDDPRLSGGADAAAGCCSAAGERDMRIATLPRVDLPGRDVRPIHSDLKKTLSFFVCNCEVCEEVRMSDDPSDVCVVCFPPGNGHKVGLADLNVPLPDKPRHAVIRHLREMKADLSNLPPALPLLEPWAVSKELKSYKGQGQEGLLACLRAACDTRGTSVPPCDCWKERTHFFCQCEVCNNDDLDHAYMVSWFSESTPGFASGFADYDVCLPPEIQKYVLMHLRQVEADFSKLPGALQLE